MYSFVYIFWLRKTYQNSERFDKFFFSIFGFPRKLSNSAYLCYYWALAKEPLGYLIRLPVSVFTAQSVNKWNKFGTVGWFITDDLLYSNGKFLLSLC